ncbi:MAG: serine/threonine-protein phosphatase [Betaproteobacteria bacterium]|nr:serine/threonine-protein phosphatase [Betaproteobacteria bacterium]
MSSRVFVGEGTDRGQMREENQDATSFYRTSDDVWTLLIVCDGMGGHAGGSQASNIASKGIGQGFADRVGSSAPADALRDSIKAVNQNIIDYADINTELRGMGTTCAVLAVAGDKAYIAHVGDSRVYRIRPGSIEQMTKDHSHVQRMIDSGILTPKQAEDHPDANRLLRCLGGQSEVEVDVIGPEPVMAGDRYLLCSDGLWGELSAAEIAAMAMAFPAQDAVNRLINLANERGGADNISVQIYHQGDAHPPTDAFSPEKFSVKKFSGASDDGLGRSQDIRTKAVFSKPGIRLIGAIAIAIFFLCVILWGRNEKTAVQSEFTQPAAAEIQKLPQKASTDATSFSNTTEVSSSKERDSAKGKPPSPKAEKSRNLTEK